MPNYNNTIVNRDTSNPGKPRVSFLGAERGYQKLTKIVRNIYLCPRITLPRKVTGSVQLGGS